MKKAIVLVSMFFCLNNLSYAQNFKEKANNIAQNDFSKSKNRKEERHGIVKEKSKSIRSTPVIKESESGYGGKYENKTKEMLIHLFLNNSGKLEGTMIKEGKTFVLREVIAKEAYFKAISSENNLVIEGAFINKADNEKSEFGLGIKIPKTHTGQTSVNERVFLKAAGE